jgi:hypothetical protein
MDHQERYRNLLNLGRHLGVAELVYERQSTEVQLLSRILADQDRDAMRLILRKRDWFVCDGYVSGLLQATDAQFDERVQWTRWAIEAMLRDRLAHASMALEGMFVRFYESVRRSYADVVVERGLGAADALEYATLDSIVSQLALMPDHPAIAQCELFRHLRNDIVHRFGIADAKSEKAVRDVAFGDGAPVVRAGQLISMKRTHAYAFVRWTTSFFREVTGVAEVTGPSGDLKTVFDDGVTEGSVPVSPT